MKETCPDLKTSGLSAIVAGCLIDNSPGMSPRSFAHGDVSGGSIASVGSKYARMIFPLPLSVREKSLGRQKIMTRVSKQTRDYGAIFVCRCQAGEIDGISSYDMVVFEIAHYTKLFLFHVFLLIKLLTRKFVY